MKGSARPAFRLFEAGDFVTHQGQRGGDVFLLLNGILGVEVNHREIAQWARAIVGSVRCWRKAYARRHFGRLPGVGWRLLRETNWILTSRANRAKTTVANRDAALGESCSDSIRWIAEHLPGRHAGEVVVRSHYLFGVVSASAATVAAVGGIAHHETVRALAAGTTSRRSQCVNMSSENSRVVATFAGSKSQRTRRSMTVGSWRRKRPSGSATWQTVCRSAHTWGCGYGLAGTNGQATPGFAALWRLSARCHSQ